MPYMDDALDKKEVFMIFDELGIQTSPSHLWFPRERLFVKTSLTTSSRQRVSRLRYTSRTTTHADYNQANKLVLVHESKFLCYLNDLTWLFCKQAIIKSVSMSTPVLPTPAVQWTTTGPAVSSARLLELIVCLADSNSSRNSANEMKQFKWYKNPQ